MSIEPKLRARREVRGSQEPDQTRMMKAVGLVAHRPPRPTQAVPVLPIDWSGRRFGIARRKAPLRLLYIDVDTHRAARKAAASCDHWGSWTQHMHRGHHKSKVQCGPGILSLTSR